MLLKQIEETVAFIQTKTKSKPIIGIILGSGLGGLIHEIEEATEIDYSTIPHFPVSTVEGHAGKLIFGILAGKPVVAMQGRFHFYEGYGMDKVVFPVRVMKFLGIEFLFVSNASGGVNPGYKVGDLMILDDHINLFPANPLIGKNETALGTRFPDMSEPYSQDLIKKAVATATELGHKVHIGVYAGVPGPTFETRAEYKYIRTIGADCVGMSTVPEIIAARHMQLKCFGISIITDIGVSDHPVSVSHEEVLAVAKVAEKKVTAIIKGLVGKV